MTVRLLAVHHGGGVGGAPVSLLKLLAALDRHDFDARAVFTEPGAIVDYAAELGVPTRLVPTGGAFFYSAHARLGPRVLARFIRTFPRAVQRARRALRQTRPDLVHLNTSVLLAWAAAARRERVPIVWVVREVPGAIPWLRRWHVNFVTRHAARVVAVSDFVRASFPASSRVYNAVDLREFRLELLDGAAAVRRELGLPVDTRLVMAVGAVQRPKGHWLLIDALTRAHDIDLVLVAGGVDAAYARSTRGRIKRALRTPLDNLEALLRDAERLGVRERIHAIGFRRDVAKVLAAADVLVFPSVEPEGFGRPIIEAMALARPVVATDVGPSAELVGPHAGCVVPPDAAVLAEALERVLRAPGERAEMGRAGRARVEACFTLDRQVAEMSSIYREAAAIA